jgi:phage host-nuclease inhibitor protein Gam
MISFIEQLLLESEAKEKQQNLELNRLRADQVLAALAVLEQKADDVNKLADDEIQIIEEYRQVELQKLEKKASWLATNLEQFIRAENKNDTACKSIALPHGNLKLRLGREKVQITDMEKFMPVAQRRGLLKQIPEAFEPDLQKILMYAKAAGTIPGIAVIPATTKFSYSTLKGSKNGNGQEPKAGTEIE